MNQSTMRNQGLTETFSREQIGNNKAASRVCVLAGTAGATAAMQRFFTRIHPSTDVAFLIAVRMDTATAHRFARVLSGSGVSLPVSIAEEGTRLKHGEIVVVPADAEIIFTEDGGIQLRHSHDDRCHAAPLDQVLQAAARFFEGNTGAVILSGIGDDGVAGCRSVVRHGGEVWVQESVSAQYRSLPEYVQASTQVAFSANPEGMADRLVQELSQIARRDLRVAAAV